MTCLTWGGNYTNAMQDAKRFSLRIQGDLGLDENGGVEYRSMSFSFYTHTCFLPFTPPLSSNHMSIEISQMRMLSFSPSKVKLSVITSTILFCTAFKIREINLWFLIFVCLGWWSGR